MKNKKSLGQNWLKDRATLLKIAALAASPETDTVLEIGPGLGTLTSALFQYFSHIIAVEFDQNLAKNLLLSFPGKNLTVINADILSLDLSTLNLPKNFVVAGNIPYYITSPILLHFLSLPPTLRPQKLVFLVQKEVAERLAAAPGAYSVLGLSVQNRAKVSLGLRVPRSFFTPPPKVDSQLVILELYQKPRIDEAVFSLIRSAFFAPRKKLIKNLEKTTPFSRAKLLEIFSELQFSPDLRPAALSLEDWQKLENIIHKR